MKFLCSNCKAKYQIADEKVAGRTLRMTCRRCKEEIVIHGGPEVTVPSLYPVGAGASPLPPPSPLGADFQMQVAGQGRAAAPIAPPIDEWHVGINDVPVGPMRREEVARKLAVGAIGPQSLAWREGLDDWLPIRNIHELAVLCGPPPGIGLPPPGVYAQQQQPQLPQAQYGGLPPVPAAAGYSGVSPMPTVQYPGVPQMPLQPAQRADLAPMGGRAGAAPQYALDDWAPVIEQVSHSKVAMNPLLEAAAAERRGPVLPSWSVMFMLTGGFALLTSVLAFMGARWLVASQRPAAAPIAGTAGGPSSAPVATAAAPQAAAQQGATNSDMVIALNDPGLQNQARGANARGAQTARPVAAGKPKKELTEEQKAMLARMGGGDSSSVANLRPAAGTTNAAGAVHGTGGLTADQLSKVVLRGRENLQRCYETALRGSGSTETVRMDVEVAVSPAGNVTSAKVNGQGLPGMSQCIERTVRMWRFPNAAEVTQTKFPVVFQPGS